jgi:hypothetical protein
MTIKRVITTKAIAFASSCFLTVWNRIESTPLYGSYGQNKPELPPFNSVPAMHEAQQHLGCAALAQSNSPAFQCPTCATAALPSHRP